MKKKWQRFRWFLTKIHFGNQILALFDTSPLHQFSKFNNFLWVCWFLGKNISDFVPPTWKLDNPYYHTEESEDSPSRFSAQWNKLFGQEASNINDNNVPDLKLDTLGQADDDFGSFFSAQTSAALAADGATKDKNSGAGGAILPSQLFDLDQSLFSLQSPKQGNDTTKTNSNSR